MLKKDQKSRHHICCPRKISDRCSMCKHCNTKQYCNCDCACVLFEEEISDEPGCRHDSGDFASGKKSVKHIRKLKKSQSLNVAQSKDLASGDHDKPNKKLHGKGKSKSEDKLNDIKNVRADYKSSSDYTQKEVETTVEYKNANFNDSSSTNLNGIDGFHEMEDVLAVLEKQVCPRPVTCPVQDCSKMIALDSVMLHFYFDHSKVPRMTLSSTMPREVILSLTNISRNTQCLAVFLTQNKEVNQPPDSSIINRPKAEKHSLLLMGARMLIGRPKTTSGLNRNKLVSVRSPHSRTELEYANTNAEQKTSIVTKLQEASHKSKEVDSSEHESNDWIDKNEVLIIWLCKLNDSTISYSISIESKDKKRAHSFTGEALHIKEKQEVTAVYQKSECLIVHTNAANRLLDKLSQLSITLNILK